MKPIKDEDATILSNGKPLEITESIYRDAKRVYMWCKQCDAVTEHLELPEYLKSPFSYMRVCNVFKHTIKLEKPDNPEKKKRKK